MRLIGVVMTLLLLAWPTKHSDGQAFVQSTQSVQEANRIRQEANRALWNEHPFSHRLKQYFEDISDVGRVSGAVEIDFGNESSQWHNFNFLAGKSPQRITVGMDLKASELRYDLLFESGTLSAFDSVAAKPMTLWEPKSGGVFKPVSRGGVELSEVYSGANIGNPMNFSLSTPPVQFVYWPYMLKWTQYVADKGVLVAESFEPTQDGKSSIVKFSSPFSFEVEFSDSDGFQVQRLMNNFLDVSYENTSYQDCYLPERITVQQMETNTTTKYAYDYHTIGLPEMQWRLVPRNGTLVFEDNNPNSPYVIGGGQLFSGSKAPTNPPVSPDQDIPLDQVQLQRAVARTSASYWYVLMASVFAISLLWVVTKKSKSRG